MFSTTKKILLFLALQNICYSINEYNIITDNKKAISLDITKRKYFSTSRIGEGLRLRYNSKFINLYFGRWDLEYSGYINYYGIGHIHKLNHNNFWEFAFKYYDDTEPSITYMLGYIHSHDNYKNKIQINNFYFLSNNNLDNHSMFWFGYKIIYNINSLSIEPMLTITKPLVKKYGFNGSISLTLSYSFIK